MAKCRPLASRTSQTWLVCPVTMMFQKPIAADHLFGHVRPSGGVKSRGARGQPLADPLGYSTPDRFSPVFLVMNVALELDVGWSAWKPRCSRSSITPGGCG